ncbi:AraC family transcriptional regulator [Marinitenerispora sediminis]|nr:AraC family transcriptional regulator [Marinitenerispora sediminis]RCV59715.1 AraC family transcriptional regulator [Marinitenerispora sediminis]
MRNDARGIIAPEAGLARFQLDRHPPSPAVARFVDRYWSVTWDLRGRAPHTQRVFAHPVVNVVFSPGAAAVHGPTTRVSEQTLHGAGWVLGVMFRPAGFRPFLGRPMSGILDAVLDLAEVMGPAAAEAVAAVTAAPDARARAAAADAFLAGRLPRHPQPSERTGAAAERAAADPAVVSVESLAAGEGLSVRQLQRRFADHVGLGPKAVIRRYRLYEVAERARRGGDVHWARLAAELGYSDQSHLTREFTAVVGTPPQRYHRACRT